MQTSMEKRRLLQGLAYLGIGGGLFTYHLGLLLTWNLTDWTTDPFQRFLTIPVTIVGGVIIFILFGMGMYHIMKASLMSDN